MASRSWTRAFRLAACTVLLGFLCGLGVGRTAALPGPLPRGAEGGAFKLVGTSSCSARDCHGGDAPPPGESPRRREYTIWNRSDRHARAYRTLFSKRAERMAGLLAAPTTRPRPAHEDVRCLGCHAVPGWSAEKNATGVRLDGVSCEACHGPAEKWWDAHTDRKAWRRHSPTTKREKYGMMPVGDTAELARTCAGCHVGAPPEPRRRLTSRDVNHDLLAAGHPPLRFELAAYLANMPAHWDRGRTRAGRRPPSWEARVWAVGQLASADAALALLAYRAEPGDRREGGAMASWPEFAEYDCFACHRDLGQAGWRQRRAAGLRPLGLLPWGGWHLKMLPGVAAALPPEPPGEVSLRKLRGQADSVLDRLETLMTHPSPDRARVAALAREAGALLSQWTEHARGKNLDAARVGALSRRLVRDHRLAEADWQSVAQLYLALAALQQAREEGGEKPAQARAAREALRRLAEKLAFPAGSQSPRDLRRDEAFKASLRDLLKPFR